VNFQSFWSQLNKDASLGKEYFTLARQKTFIATFYRSIIIIKPEKTKYERSLSQNEFFKIWTKDAKSSFDKRFIHLTIITIRFTGLTLLP